MKKIIAFLSALVLMLPCGDAFAQKDKSPADYNLQKAWDALREDNDQAKALELVNGVLKDSPDNVEALILRARLFRYREEYGPALRDINHALEVNRPRKSGTPMSFLHWWKGHIYADMEEDALSVESLKKAYELARKDNKDNLQGISFDYAQALYNVEDLDGADAVYRAMLAADEADQPAMVGLARNMIDRGQYREALAMMEKCEKYDADYEEIYRFKMKAYDRLGEASKAVDACLEWYAQSSSPQTDSVIAILSKRPNYAVASIKRRGKDSDEPMSWDALLCQFYEETRQYAEAVRSYDRLEADYGQMTAINYHRSNCYSEMDMQERAIADISKALDKDPDVYSLVLRAAYYRLVGNLDAGMADLDAAIEEMPDLSYPYCRRGKFHELKGDRKKAMEDYDLSIELDEDVSYQYLLRGKLRLKEGDGEGARADFEQIVKRDTVVDSGSCRHYALHYLGKDREAEEWADKIVAIDPDDPGPQYDRACLLSLEGRADEAVAGLRTAFEKGFRSFSHLRQDDDMDPVRDLPAFKAMVDEYAAKHAEFLKEFERENPEKVETITEIAFQRKSGGTFEIPCDINGLPLQMIFDTGASDVSISSVEANFMLKNGYLSEKDIKGKNYYQTADGEISVGTVVVLREVKIGDAVLHNVDASVVKNQKAPLLLGQSAMERFGTITIDNIGNKLIIKH